MLRTAKPRSKEAHTPKKCLCQLEGRASFPNLLEKFAEETIKIMRQKIALEQEKAENGENPLNSDLFTEESHGR